MEGPGKLKIMSSQQKYRDFELQLEEKNRTELMTVYADWE